MKYGQKAARGSEKEREVTKDISGPGERRLRPRGDEAIARTRQLFIREPDGAAQRLFDKQAIPGARTPERVGGIERSAVGSRATR